ncbi:hypothetical protein VKT23_019376 [Stygiomarasmius scandens]|uniref:Chromatin elongation factor spt5 n=1 Tax=Marasmiellus scandens TaxID=2682957 RepID=A0ABR1ILH8_9AGAR
MANPFIDDFARDDDGDYSEEEDEDYTWNNNEDWNDENDPKIHEDEALETISNPTASAPVPRARIEAVTRQLLARYVVESTVNSAHVSNAELNVLGNETHSPVQKLEPGRLKSVLCSNEQIFWRVKCKLGSEMDLLFDIMRESESLMSASLPRSPVPSSMEPPVSSAARALQIIRRYALTQQGEPKTVADDLEKLLGSEWSVEWTRLIDFAGLEPGENDVQAALANVNERAKSFLPTSVIQEADLCFVSPTNAHPGPVVHHASDTLDVSSKSEGGSILRSVFCVPTVNGFVYLEGRYDSHWLHWFARHSAVIKTGQPSKVWIEHVDHEEIGILLDTPAPSILPFSWVRVKKGSYRDDVGLVLSAEMLGGQRRFSVLLVPRLRPHSKHNKGHPVETGKRKRDPDRYPQKLLDLSTFDSECQKVSDHVYEWRNGLYRHGLIMKHYDGSSLSQTDVFIDKVTRRFFELSGDPVLKRVRFPIPEDWIFFADEEVIAVVGAPLTDRQKINPDLPQSSYHKNAVIVDAGAEHCTVQFDDYREFDLEDTKTRILNLNLRKRIGIGHSIEVVAGDLKGRNGLVVESSFNIIQVRGSGGDHFEADVNCCRITARRDFSAVPWINRHIAVVLGHWRGYSGIIVDVYPPKPHYTMLEVKIARLGTSIQVPHDLVVDTMQVSHSSLEILHWLM